MFLHMNITFSRGVRLLRAHHAGMKIVMRKFVYMMIVIREFVYMMIVMMELIIQINSSFHLCVHDDRDERVSKNYIS